MSVTLIAEKAGVSIATVSRVLNNHRTVNPKLVEQVRRAVQELQISPRRNRKRSVEAIPTKIVALLTLGQQYRNLFQMPVMGAVLAELNDAAQDHGLTIQMAEMPDPNVISPVLKGPEITGAFVFCNANLSHDQMKLLHVHMPIVRVLGAEMDATSVDHVTADHAAIGTLAAQYLLDRGCRNLAFYTVESRWVLSRLRAQGFLHTGAANGAMVCSYCVSASGEHLHSYGRDSVAMPERIDLIRKIAESKRAYPDHKLGLFVSRDAEVVEVYRMLRETRLEPERDVVVVSCDNENIRLSHLDPRPMSIDLNPREIARRAVRRLQARMQDHTEPPVRILVTPHLATEIPAAVGFGEV